MTARIINLAKFKAERAERDRRRADPFGIWAAWADLFSFFWRN